MNDGYLWDPLTGGPLLQSANRSPVSPLPLCGSCNKEWDEGGTPLTGRPLCPPSARCPAPGGT